MYKFDKQVESDDVERRLECILNQLIQKKDSNYHLYLWGMGGQTRGFYKSLDENDVYKVLYYGSIMSGPFKVFSFIPSQAGLIEIKKVDKGKIIELFFSVGECSMVGLYGFRSQQVAEEFIMSVCENSSKIALEDSMAEKDLAYFSYIVDFDNTESETEIYEIVAFGENSPIKIEQ